MVKYFSFDGVHGHQTKELDDDKVLQKINEGLKEGKYIVVKCEDGETLTSADAVHELDADKSEDGKKKFKKAVKKKLKLKKVKEVDEIRPIAGG